MFGRLCVLRAFLDRGIGRHRTFISCSGNAFHKNSQPLLNPLPVHQGV
jgi:hypothetical protein